MRSFVTPLIAALFAVTVSGQAGLPSEANHFIETPKGWSHPKTAWGDPDLTGMWPVSFVGTFSLLWLFGFVVFLRIAQSLAVIFNGYNTAVQADGFPLDTFPQAARETVLALFALTSVWRLTFASVCALVLVRYRSAVPLMFLVLILNFLAAELLLQFIPLPRAGTPPGPCVNLAQLGLAIIGLVLSLRSRVGARTAR